MFLCYLGHFSFVPHKGFTPCSLVPLESLHVPLLFPMISAVQTPVCSSPSKKISSSGKFVKIRNLMEISHFKVELALSLFLFFNTSHEHFVLCLWQAYAASMRVFTSLLMDSGFFTDVRQ